MKITATRNVMIKGVAVKVGQEVETDERTAKYLIAIGKAKLVTATPAKTSRKAISKKADGAEKRTE